MSVTGATLFVASVLILFRPEACNGRQVSPDFSEFMSMVPGFYDNQAQFQEDVAMGLPANQRHCRLALSVTPQDIPFLSERRNFHLLEFMSDDLSKLIRQRIYSFWIDPLTLAMELKFYKLKNESRFIAAEDYDPAFLDLCPGDVTHHQGCDVYWYKADVTPSARFESWMKPTCYADIKGDKVLIMDTNNWTSSYLTVFEHWFASNGTRLMGLPSPHNLTKQTTGAPWRSRPSSVRMEESTVLRASGASSDRTTRFLIPDRPSLNSFGELLEALFSGQPVRFHANLSTCNASPPEGTVTPPTELAALIDAYEYFNLTILTMEPHVGFSWSTTQVSDNGVESVLTEIRVYDLGKVGITLTFLSADLRQLLGKVSYECTMSVGQSMSSPSVTFRTEDVKLTPLRSYDELRKALQSGRRVSSASDYGLCSVQKNAVGGAAVDDVRFYHDRITSSALKTITNYQGPGYVYDIVTTTFWENGSVISTASDRDVVTFKPYYVEQIDCGLIGGKAVKFVQIF